MRTALLVLLFVMGCSEPVARRVNIAPSAEVHAEAIMEAVEALNAYAGTEAFQVRVVSSGEAVEDEITIRLDDKVELKATESGVVTGLASDRRGDTWVIRLSSRARVKVIAHELGHTVWGRGHSDDPTNLMAAAVPDEWHLDADQVEVLRNVP